jgi:cysteine desulfurase
LTALRTDLERKLLAAAPDVTVFGSDAERLPNTTLFAAPGLRAETAVIAFDLEGIAVSAGSACSSGKIAESHVLTAMGEAAANARGGIRVSLAVGSNEAEVDAFIAAWRSIHARMGRSKAA